jgi:tryptophan halogenase
VLLGETLDEPFVSFSSSLFCDRAVVGGWARGADEVIKPYTTAETMDAGWAWQIEHENRVNRGYVYSSAFISDDDARAEFVRKNPKVGDTRVVKYRSGRYRRGWVHNVVGIGNSFGFVEPLESTSLAAICDQCKSLANSLIDCMRDPGPGMALAYNLRQSKQWEDIRAFLAIHYKFNTRLDTPFWRACLNDTDVGDAADFCAYYLDNGPSTVWREDLIGGHDVFGFEGYLSLMVGMNVPFKRRYRPSEQEMATWRRIQGVNREKGMQGVGVKETLDLVRGPNWRFKEGFYKME